MDGLRRHAVVTLTAVACLPAVAVATTSAAVLVCGGVVSSPIIDDKKEINAKRTALAAWQQKARVLGTGYDSWRLARTKALKCYPSSKGSQCVAIGRPCRIRQVPPKTAPAPGSKSQSTQL